jgi:hydrogenase nickel incorporation protein HypA/HybF
MHELSLAEAIVDVAVRHAAGRPVSKVEVSVGHLRQVVPEALEFAFGLVAQGTALDGVMDGFPLCCAACGGLEMDVLSGEELSVDALEIEDGPVTSEGTSHGSHV